MSKDDSPEALLSQLQRYRTLLRRADDSLLWNGIRKQIELLETRLARVESTIAAAERRSSDRVATKIRGRLARGDRNFLIETVDLSAGGALLLAKGAPGLGPGDPVNLALSGIGELKGEVVANSTLGLHLRFTDEGLSPKEKLLGAIERLNRMEGKFIDAAQAIAAEIGAAFEAAVTEGRIALDDLFDTNYRQIAGTNPAQYMTKYAELAEQLLPPIQEPALTLDKSVVFCTAVDQNGYLPADNRKFLPAKAGMNAMGSRHRRIADDAIGLAAARNTRAFLLQNHQTQKIEGASKDNGAMSQLKEVNSPIKVTGRHWGGLRLAFHL